MVDRPLTRRPENDRLVGGDGDDVIRNDSVDGGSADDHLDEAVAFG